MATATTPPPTEPALDEARIEEFAGQLFDAYTGGMVTYMIDLGHRTGLLDALADAPATSAELAARTGCAERYVREWLGSLTTARIVDYDAATRIYTLPAEHAVCLSGSGSLNLAPLSKVNTLLATYVEPVAGAFADGGGVPYEAFRPEFTDVMDGISRGLFDGQLIDGIVPLATGLPAALERGIRVADIGCGTGHSTTLLAQAFPRSEFVGYDLAADAIERARDEAAAAGLDNVRFEVRDLAQLAPEPAFDAVVGFDVIHDQAAPATVLARVYDALADGGVFLMMDIRAASDVEDNVGNPCAPMLYAVSTLHCMTVSLAEGGAGLGTVWGERVARQMLADAGFSDVTVHEVPDDPLNSVYVARKRAGS